jgi:hypothetical protein
MLKVYYLIVFFCLTISSTIAQSLYNDVGHIPESSRIDWTNAGLINKIDGADHFINISDYSGTDFEKITAALDDASEDGITMIYFPAGDYSFDNTINLKSNIVLMGEGEGITRFYFPIDQCSHCINITGNARTNELEIAVDIPKNGNEVTVLENLVENGYGGFPWIQYGENLNPNSEHDGYSFLGQVSKITNYDSPTSITVKDEASKAYSTGYDLKVWKMNPIENVGIENLSIERQLAFGQDGQGKGRTISINNAVNCWIRGVQLVRATGRHFTISHSAHIEISGCYANGAYHTHSDNSCGGGEDGFGYGIVLGESAVNCLIENNIFKGLRHSMLVGTGANTNVFTYNYSKEARIAQELEEWEYFDDLTLHGRYPYANLFEHNWVRRIEADDTHGNNGPFNAFVRNICEENGTKRGIVLKNAPHSAVIGNRLLLNIASGHPIITEGNTSLSVDLYGIQIYSGQDYETGDPRNHYFVAHTGGYGINGGYRLLDYSYFYSEGPYFLQNDYFFPSLGPLFVDEEQRIPAKDRYDNSSEKTYNLYPTRPPIEISIDQKNSSNTSFGEIEYWLETWQPPIAVPNQFEYKANSDIVLRADKNINENEKFNNWNGSFYHNHYIFLIGEESVSYTAFHEQVVSVSLQAVNILGEPIAKNIDFKDPWLNDYSDSPYGLRNQGKSAPFLQYSTPYSITLDSPHFGVIKDQFYHDPSKPYYAVKTEDTNFIDQIDGEEWAIEFHHWSEPNGKATFQNADALETPVVFHADGAEIRANYDPYTRHLASETDPLIRNNGDRVMVYGKETHPLDIPVDSGHLVYDGNRFFMVYQEDNQLFLTSSANCETWTVDELLPQSVHSYLGTEVEVEIVDYSIAFANGSIDSDFNRSAFSIAWVERVTAGGGFTGYAAYYVEKDIATNSWSNLIELENSFLVGSAEILNGIELLTDIKGDSENYASFVAVLEKELDGSFYFDAIRSIAGQGQFETVFENKPGRQVSITSEGMGSSLSYLYIAYLDDDELTHQGYNIVNGRFDQKRVISSLFPNSYDHQNPSIIYVSEGDHNDPRYSYIAWEATRGGYSEIVTAKVNSQGSGSVESGHVVSARYQRKNCTSPVLSYNQVSHEFALTYESAGEVIQIANLDTFSPRQWYYKNYGEGYAPTAPRYHAPGIAYNQSEADFHRIKATRQDPNYGPNPGPVKLKEVQRIDYQLSALENGGQEGLISIDLVELKKENEPLPVAKDMKTKSVSFDGRDQISYAVSVRFINVSQTLNPDKVLLSLALEADESKLPLSNFKVREVSAESENEIKDFIKASTVTNLPVSNGQIEVELGVAAKKEHYTILMTQEDIDNSLSKAIRIEDEQFSQMIPTQYALDQNYPNPFNPFTTITYALPEQGNVELTVYNSLGQKVKTLVNKHQQAGYHSYIFNGNSVASGIYFYSLKTASYQQTRKMLLIK